MQTNKSKNKANGDVMELIVCTLSFQNKQELYVVHKFLTLSYYIQNGRVRQRAPSMI